MNFKERTSTNMTVKARENSVPTVYINRSALNKMFIYTDEVPDEVGWLGTVQKVDNSYHVTDVFLFDQQVHGATTEITPEGLTEFAEELLQRSDGVEIWNSMRLWGHSHVNMGISPSGQDNKQMEDFSQIGHDFFLRLICNKKGELGIDVYDYKLGIEFHNVPWVIHENEVDEVGFQMQQQIQQMQEALEALQKQVEEREKAQVEAIKEPIKAEIKEKVRKFVYQTPKTQPNYYGSGYGGWATGSSKGKDYPKHEKLPDVIDNVKNTVRDFFSDKDLMLLAHDCYGYYDMQMLIEADGFEFSDNDYMVIWREVKKIQDREGISNNDIYGGYY